MLSSGLFWASSLGLLCPRRGAHKKVSAAHIADISDISHPWSCICTDLVLPGKLYIVTVSGTIHRSYFQHGLLISTGTQGLECFLVILEGS